MRFWLLVAGVGLTLLALGSEEKLVVAYSASAAPTTQSSIVSPMVQGVSGAFDKMIVDAVVKGINNAEQTLASYQPALRALSGDTRGQAKELAGEIARSCSNARAELNKGRTFAALDHVMRASFDLDELKKVFERR